MTDEPKAPVVPPMPDQDWEQDTPDFIEELRAWGTRGWEIAQAQAQRANEAEQAGATLESACVKALNERDALQARIAELKATLINRGSVYVTDGHGCLWGTPESITWVTDELDRLEATLAQRDREVLGLRAALERVVSRFAPVKHEFIFSQRNALEKAESALASTAQAADEADADANAAADAERYMWLRRCDKGALEGGAHVIIPGKYGIGPATSGEELDVAIDRAEDGAESGEAQP